MRGGGGLGTSLRLPNGISNNETDLLIRMSIQSFSSGDPWGSERDGRAQLWWARGKLTVSLKPNIQAVLKRK